MPSPLAFLASFVAAGATLLVSPPARAADAQAVHWYNGSTRMTVYHQPGLYVAPTLPATAQTRSADNRLQALGQRGPWTVYQFDATTGAATRAQPPSTATGYYTLYSSERDWRSGALSGQAAGILIVFKPGHDIDEIADLLRERQLTSRKLPTPRAYRLDGIEGLPALILSGELYERGIALLAQPNWHSPQRKR